VFSVIGQRDIEMNMVSMSPLSGRLLNKPEDVGIEL